MTQSTIPKRRFDVAIFVATDDEHAAVLEDGQWHTETDINQDVIHMKCLKTQGDFIIRLALRKLPFMGAEACVLSVSKFLAAYECGLVAMTGVCGGINEEVGFCDIVIPGMVASICNGKETEDSTGRRVFLPSNRLHTLDSGLGRVLESFKYYKEWDRLKNEIRSKHTDTNVEIPNFALRYGASNMMVQVFHVLAYTESDKDLKILAANRNVHALDMESAALAFAAEENQTPWLVIKGVQDFAGTRKDDKFRKFCAWASYRTLKEIVACCLGEFWKEKVRIVAENPSMETGNEDTEELNKVYRMGNYDVAHQKAKTAFERRPYDIDICELYLHVLMRRSEYRQAGELIDVVDYYVQNHNSDRQHFDYRVARAEYYWRIGSLEEARRQLDSLIAEPPHQKTPDHDDMIRIHAQAFYVRGMVYLTLYRKVRREDDLKSAYYDFQMAVKLDRQIEGKKYWAFVHLLLTRHLLNEPWDESIVVDANKRLRNALNDSGQRVRSVPRIYRLRLTAIELAAGWSSFQKLRNIIKGDKKRLSGKLLLPQDFFGEFDQDCRLLFDLREHQRDQLLSLIYDWASVVRKRKD